MFFTLEQMVMGADDMFRMLTMGVNKEVERYHDSDCPIQREEAANLIGELNKSLIDLSFSLKGLQAILTDDTEEQPAETEDNGEGITDLAKSVLSDLAKINDKGHRPA